MASSSPEERVAHAAVRQSWRQVSFLHWRVEADAIQPLLPQELVVEELDGTAWVGLTPFSVTSFGIFGLPPVPGIADFCETNLRTYVRHRSGHDGLWFLSLDVSSALNVLGGRFAGVPYFLSTMTVDEHEGAVRYRARRRVGPTAHHDIVVRPNEPLPASESSGLVEALTGRWRAFTTVGGRLLEVAVEHQPWPLRHATIEALDESTVAASGIRAPSGKPIVHYSDGVDARLSVPRAAGEKHGSSYGADG